VRARFLTRSLQTGTSGRIPQFRKFLLDIEVNLKTLCDDATVLALQVSGAHAPTSPPVFF
jgi:hypothetical protein